MDRILRETHKKQNIDLLKVRDYFFDKARKLNKLNTFLEVLPVIILFVSYIPFISDISFINEYRDYCTGILTIVLFFICFFIDRKIDENLEISNTFREEYDVRVFGIEKNQYIYDYSCIEKYKPLAQKITNSSPKYEYWYEEIFCDNHLNNVICCQMDNVIYTYHVYKKTEKVYTFFVSLLAIFLFLIWAWIRDANFLILSVITMFSIFQMFFVYINVANELVENNKYLFDLVLNSDKKEYTMEEIRYIQDCLIINRNSSLFIPKFIRNSYLKDANPYYKDLDKIKNKLMDKETVSIPSTAQEIEILSPDGMHATNLTVIHNRLRVMLQDIKTVLDKHNIQYTLDGGTLIGAIREKGKYIFWDDDIDLAIRYEDFCKAKKVLETELGQKYNFQDYYNETYYSPRLSSLRMREKNTKGVIEEKDSTLFELYEKRGLFIDIYVYAPILHDRYTDSIYRKFRIHTIHKKIKKIEDLWKSDKPKYEKKLIQLKKRYLKRVEWYLSHAKCQDYYAYTPNYIENLKHPGPYIKKESLYATSQDKTPYCNFEGFSCPIPVNSAEVLQAYYGKTWNQSPFKPLETIGNYSQKNFPVTKMKHVGYFEEGER